MNKIKIVSALIIVLLIALAFFSKYAAEEEKNNRELVKIVDEQKAFTQEIAKNIFYLYKNQNSSFEEFDKSLRHFVQKMNSKKDLFDQQEAEEIKIETDRIALLWNDFYLLVQNFRDKSKIRTPYTQLLLDKMIHDIYRKNLNLVEALNRLIEVHKNYFNTVKKRNQTIEIILFSLIITLLLYLFTQLKEIILFMQKFLKISKNIIQKSTLKEIEPIELTPKVDLVCKASNDFNFLVEKIIQSIDISTKSMQNTTASLEQIEKNIEDLLELIAVMDDENSIDKELIKKEDILIESLDAISSSVKKLQKLQDNLQNFKK